MRSRSRSAHDPDRLLAEALAIEAELARRSLRRFVETAWPIVEPDVPFCGNWHIDVLCEQLERVSRGEIDRLLVNVPPGTSKSLLVSVLWPAWEWATSPALRYLTFSYSEQLTIRDNLRVRDILQSPWYRRHFPQTQLRADQNAKLQFDTTAAGWRLATSVGGRGTGLHPDRIIIDDPHSALQAHSEAERQAVITWVDGTVSSRGVVRGVAVVVIMQRLHEQDLSGYLLAKGGWTHVCWPMRFEPDRADPIDRRRTAGELLWPALFTEAKVARLERDMGSYEAAGQLQQRPTPPEGGLIKRSWWQWYSPDDEHLTKGLREIVISVDTATKAKATNDYSVIGLWGKNGGPDVYGLKVLRDRWEYPELVRQLLSLHQWARERWPAVLPTVIVEDASAGPEVVAELRRRIPGVIAEKPRGDKVQRVHAVLPMIEAGNVWLPGRALPDGRLDRNVHNLPGWVDPFVEECAAFPMGTHDDQVDQLSQALRRLCAPRAAAGMMTLAGL